VNAIASKAETDAVCADAASEKKKLKKKHALEKVLLAVRNTIASRIKGRAWNSFQSLRASYEEMKRQSQLAAVDDQVKSLRLTIMEMERELTVSAEALRVAEAELRRAGIP